MIFKVRIAWIQGGAVTLPGFTLAYEAWEGEHHFAIFDVDADAVLDLFAETIRDLYVESDTLRITLTSALAGLDDVVDLQDIEALVSEVTEAAVPLPGQNQTKPHLDMARNEAAEVLAHLVAERLHGGLVVANRVRNKEIPGQPTRGMDLLALEESSPKQLRLVCGEVKASSSNSSPPAVVDKADDSMRNQLKRTISDHARILQELNWAHKHAKDGNKPMVARAMLLWTRKKLPVVILPVLMRTSETGQESDFGTFKSKPTEFTPAVIRFFLAKISISIEEFAERAYTKAREVG
ncbi:Hachiman antiphage defense system protein HamA [Streptosporangium sp. NPDC001681]|uniref:Hachiman antiphage defense system protein HamA n=1 Tax=Streptosporangium sp. NPDC001681 TaxID=3154395 RepID=UPI00331CD523